MGVNHARPTAEKSKATGRSPSQTDESSRGQQPMFRLDGGLSKRLITHRSAETPPHCSRAVPSFPPLCVHAAALFPLHLRSPIVLLRSAARPRKWVLLAAVLAMRRSLPRAYAACPEMRANAGGSRRTLARGKHVLVTLAAETGIKSPRSFAFLRAARIINVAAASLRPCASRCLCYM